MRLKTLYLENFGPFKEYEVEFPTESKSCILITGKNNTGKTTIVRGINLISSTLNFARSSKKPIEKQLFKKDVQSVIWLSLANIFANELFTTMKNKVALRSTTWS